MEGNQKEKRRGGKEEGKGEGGREREREGKRCSRLCSIGKRDFCSVGKKEETEEIQVDIGKKEKEVRGGGKRRRNLLNLDGEW